MRIGNVVWKQILTWICIAIFLMVQQGCATFSLDNLFGHKQPAELGHVGITSPATDPGIRAVGLSKQDSIIRNETLGGAAAGSAGGVGAGFAVCTPSIIIPWAYAACIATLGVTGLLIGTVAGREVVNATDTEEFTAILPAGIDLQALLRTNVISLINNPVDKPVMDLGTQVIENNQVNGNVQSVDMVQSNPQKDTVDYRRYAPQGIDTVLETNILNVGLHASGNNQYRLVLGCRSRLINTTNGNEIMSRDHYYNGPEFMQETGSAQDRGIKIQVLNAGIESIAHEIVREYFPQEK